MTTATGQLDGLKALVTGAGSGLGQATAHALAAAGADVVVTELPHLLDKAQATATAAHTATGRHLTAVPLDVRIISGDDPASISSCLRAATEALGGRLDILVNNAGINVPQPAFEVTEENWDRILDINLKGLFFTCQQAGMIMRDQQPAGGCIINIASIMGLVGYRNRAAYCSSKAGVVNLTRVLAFEWAELGIRVNAVCPTFVDTPLTRPTFADPVLSADIYARMPIRRLATPDEIAAAVVYFASPAAAIVTGASLAVDGGWTAV